jgi:hypothetical protein
MFRGWRRGRSRCAGRPTSATPTTATTCPGCEIVPHLCRRRRRGRGATVRHRPRRRRRPGEGPPRDPRRPRRRAAELVAAEPDEPWLLWCGLNDEADLLAELIPGAVNVHGSMSPEEKADALLASPTADPRPHHQAVDRRVRAELAALRPHGVRRPLRLLRGLLPGHPPLLPLRPDPVVDAHIVLSDLEGRSPPTSPARNASASAITAELVAEMRAAEGGPA